MKKVLIIFFVIYGTLLFANNDSTKVATAHDFELENLKGKKIKLSDIYKDKLVVLDFWANWCVPCKKELPELDKLQKKYKDFIQVIAVDIDKARHLSKAKTYAKSKKFSFEIVFDTDQKVMNLYNVKVPPFTFIISKNGEIIWSHLGYKRGDEKEIETQIIKLIELENNDSLQTEINGEIE
ncbi:MAG: TlpA family protein disulfide reductase [Candidatus Cloacimonetes bacterium]|nr:TlpA family protein disulfide reductase [Candidatus Cloacimonadota bacterium]